MQIDEIRQMIEQGLPGADIMLDGDGTHFQAVIVSDEFTGKNMVQRHQMVYKTLGPKMGNEIHALSMQVLTTDEWNKQRDLGVFK